MFRLLKRGLKRSHQNTTTPSTTVDSGSPTSAAAAAAAANNAEETEPATTTTDTSSCFVVINNGVPTSAAAGGGAAMGGTTSKEAAAAPAPASDSHDHSDHQDDDRSITLTSIETETEETKGSGASTADTPTNNQNNKNNDDSDSSAEYSNYDNFGERSHLSNNSATTTASVAADCSAGSCSGRGSTGSRRRKRRRRRGSLKHSSNSQSNSSSISDIHNSNEQGNQHSMPDREMDSQNSGEDGDDDIQYDDDDASYSSYSSCSSSSWSDYDTLEFGRLLSLSEQKQMREQQQQQQKQGAAANDTGMDCEGDGGDGDESKPPMTITTNTEQATEGAAGTAPGAAAATAPAKNVLGKPKRKELLEDLARTHFPDFFMDTEQNVPGAIKVGEDSASESSDDEAAVERKAVQYRTKEDQDVAVFLSLAQRMSLESLLHLLQGHVQSQREELARSYMEQYHSILRRQDTQGSSSNSLHDDLFDDNVSCSSRLVSDRSDSSLASDFDPAMVRASAKIKPILKHPEEDEEDLVKEHQADAVRNKEEAGAMTSDSPVGKLPGVSQGETDEQKHRRKHRHRHHHHHRPKPRLVKGKQFRWALVKDDQVRVVVHEVDSYKEFAADMWWNHEQMTQIRAHLIDTVKFFRKHRPMYLQSVEIVARNANMLLEASTKALEDANNGGGNSSVPPELLALQQQNLKAQTAIVEEHMKSLMNNDHAYARGLETHICKFLSEHRRSTVRAVIEEQDDCRNCHDDDDTTLHCLREQSVAYSNMSSKFSAALAKCDHIDALKASMSTWKSEVEPINQS
mmetsp:Transcript_46728/g.113872  ORF Transcript_46728/g.113872 Transcript_46728/m.113872 type:complete len:799 (-) Transcript_46728:118-2514(-)|eukprot:CAMPEP_0113441670 /NCGR_PEP_ID=MMETSP0014_2-20120614/1204_1 /TAXON_ID=2857 /ORGANISM="Nitzschia sp." /LENGTH=798 /DNA_ID=CAMNT_0000332525 /DNA_START=539 /DNA_END=2935 /DNA_ORIENTATION=- /assembly_acc=CAM_ASM_000159